ncbi:hypothetical protein [Mucilaginibacter gilvus]|uniref:Uncharacterized protein n=1 Tax=Mucilaginibacter gilvus TaxID=2305909 RepID=A0A3S3UJX3_9SPHI|nr:hypothetical protein [Mucilaginibacter gilvus]RWY48126.1 hypothetical protein EPL05_21335 [Mucilaginibacter gilvus]
MDNQPKMRPEWVPEAYKTEAVDKTVGAKPVVKLYVEKSGFKRCLKSLTPRKLNPGGGKAAPTGGLDRKRGRT